MVFNANGTASFPESLRIHTLEVSLSLMVTSAPLWLLPITVSISKSPNLFFRSTITLQYKSAMAKGCAELVMDVTEKIMALRAICNRFLPNHMEAFNDALTMSLHQTTVVRISLTEPPTGKRKQYDPHGDEMKGE